MARVTIYVECDGGSVIEVTEQSLLPVHATAAAAPLVEQAFVRTCRALGVGEWSAPGPVEQVPPSPEPGAPSGSPDPPGQHGEIPAAPDSAATTTEKS